MFISVNCEALSLGFKLVVVLANKGGQANRENRENVVHVSILMTLGAHKYNNRTTNINAHTHIHKCIHVLSVPPPPVVTNSLCECMHVCYSTKTHTQTV